MAQASAKALAEGALRERLYQETEPVPCPKCGWIQADMVADLRRKRHRWVLWLGVGVPALVVFIVLIMIMRIALVREADRSDLHPCINVGIVAIGFAVVSSLYRLILVRRFDPDEAYPKWPRTEPGRPPALVAGPAGADGRIPLVVAKTNLPEQDDGWLDWNLVEDRFVPVCCCCLAPGSCEFHLLLSISQELPVPLCSRCAARINLRWWEWAVGCVAVVCMAMLLVCWVLADLGDMAGFMAVAGSALFSWVALMIIPRAMVRPYDARVVDADRAIVRLYFVNHQYTQLLHEAARQRRA
ncbi:MAG: hypothetical protein ACHRHE_18345, partial [Tepidisphaerales bacterium]